MSNRILKLSFQLSWRILASALALSAASCSRDSGENIRDQAAAQGILLLGNESEAPSLDPHLNTALNGSRIVNALIEGLVAYHPSDDNQVVPGVAESWSHEDYQTWTFKLRSNALWSNGDPVTAQDFLYAFQRMLTPSLGANYAEMLFIIRDAGAFNQGEIDDFSEVGVSAPDAHTLRIELKGPTPYFLNLLAHHAWFPVHPPTIEAHGGMGRPDSPWTRLAYVGNGPFVMKEWSLNKIVRVARSPTYWDAEQVKLNEIHFFPIDDIATEDQSFNSGRLHYQSTVPSDMIPVYKQNEDPYLRMDPWFASYYYKINTTEAPFDDARVRRALSLAINRRAIVERIMRGDQAIALSVTPPGIAGYEPPTTEDFNPNEARQLLAEAGFPNGEGFPRFTLLYNTSDQHKAVAEAIGEMWKNALGIEVDLRNQEWKTFIEAQDRLAYQISRSGWIGDYPYPDTFLTMFRTGDGNNRTGWSNERYDQVITQSLLEANPEKRLALLREGETILMQELPVIPLFFYNRIVRIDPAVKNWNPLLLDNRNYKFIHF